MVNDTVCLSNDVNSPTCVTNFPFFVITKRTTSFEHSGIVGLIFYQSYYEGLSYMKRLNDQYSIWDPIISFQLSNIENQSEIHFGYINENSYTGQLQTHKHSCISYHDTWRYMWCLSAYGIAYGSNRFARPELEHVVLDTTVSFIMMPASDWNNFIKILQENAGGAVVCSDSGCFASEGKSCYQIADKLQNLKFYIDDKEYVIPPSGYLLDNLNG